MKKEQSRILYLDALRLIATFAVIAIHVSATGYTKTVNVLQVGGFCSVSELWGGDLFDN
jgi:surface polysaccharide O-acyltransferase-like enzyme